MEGEKTDTAEEEEGQSSAKGVEERGKSQLKRPKYLFCFCRYLYLYSGRLKL